VKDDDLQKRLERLGSQLVGDIEAWEKRTRTDRARALDELTRSLGGALGEVVHTITSEAEKAHAQKEARRERLRREREARHPPSVAAGVALLAVAALCAVLALLNPHLWWMVFVTLGLGLSGARQLAGASRDQPGVAPSANGARAPTHEVDALCDQLLADLEASPDAVKAFVSDPKKTVASMRSTLGALDVRRRQLLAEDAQGRLEALSRQQRDLEARRSAASDPEALGRWSEALASLDEQRRALVALKAATERVDGEYTSLLVHLQELRTRVSLARSASTHVQLEGLEASVRRLNDELNAISEAMEAVRRGDVTTVAEVGESRAPTREGTRVR
jgi:hypothetical protein